ncbi:Uma2 family endonuclease [Nocardia wallacei]|uniref:Putative restriction endonuclease domain-containing protein n=1 Tax=Nocardia wallacei TaxID=480035 RepID=A0A7G1KGM2_9NOCA|nr:Uma2 family endonuclease [Nocardia wallacei]BCK54130.1 hypothetical protein NWFMUON74_19020 [Nocardia wallacei]
MTVPALHPRPGNLRAVAEEIERATGLRAEILRGTLVMSPPPRGKHVGTVRRLRQQLEPRMPEGLAPYEVSSISMPDDEDDYCTPDLVVLSESWNDDDNWLADPADAELAVEVISNPRSSGPLRHRPGHRLPAAIRRLTIGVVRRG